MGNAHPGRGQTRSAPVQTTRHAVIGARKLWGFLVDILDPSLESIAPLLRSAAARDGSNRSTKKPHCLRAPMTACLVVCTGADLVCLLPGWALPICVWVSAIVFRIHRTDYYNVLQAISLSPFRILLIEFRRWIGGCSGHRTSIGISS